MKRVLITGSAGFIGTHVKESLKGDYAIAGIDVLENIGSKERSCFFGNSEKVSIQSPFLDNLELKPDILIHLAAETGIAGSLENPSIYFHQNVEGTFNVLEQCRRNGVKFLIYASSSSVYEPNQSSMSELSPCDEQLSFYGTSKRMTEIMIENYCRQFGMVAIGLRFFTVYGSWTRPDMAAYKFMKAIDAGNPVTLYNEGKVYRDFTHISDIVMSIRLLIKKIVVEDAGFHQIFNIGYGSPISVKEYAGLIAHNLGKELTFENKPLPQNELSSTHCCTEKLESYIGYKPNCAAEKGIEEMVEWFKLHRYD